MKKIYLACPFSSPDEDTRMYRFEAANQKAAELMNRGYVVFSPISHSVPINRYLEQQGLPAKDLDFWMAQDLPMVAACDELWVLALPGWRESPGVQKEIEFAKNRGMNVRIITV